VSAWALLIAPTSASKFKFKINIFYDDACELGSSTVLFRLSFDRP